jgi:hypothetical protein
MRFLRPHVVLLVLAAYVPLAIAQDQSVAPPTTYTYHAINFPEATNTYAYGINNMGEVVGGYTGAGCSQSECGFTEVKGVYTGFECSPFDETIAFDINNKDEIIGSYATNDDGAVVGMVYEGANSCNPVFDPLATNLTEAWGVNDSGVIVGFYTDSAGNFQGFRDVDGTYTTIACPDIADTRAFGVNDTNIVVGDTSASTAGPFSGMMYKSGKCTSVNFPKAVSTSAKGINKTGEISGWYTDSTGVTHGFAKTGSTFQSINYPGATGTLAYHLNDSGQIPGYYSDSAGAVHGFIAIPKQ